MKKKNKLVEAARGVGSFGFRAVKAGLKAAVDVAESAYESKLENDAIRESIRSTLPSDMSKELQDMIIERKFLERKARKSSQSPLKAHAGDTHLETIEYSESVYTTAVEFKPIRGVHCERHDSPTETEFLVAAGQLYIGSDDFSRWAEDKYKKEKQDAFEAQYNCRIQQERDRRKYEAARLDETIDQMMKKSEEYRIERGIREAKKHTKRAKKNK